MPWKNGGGETTEIMAWPQGAGLDDFGWRVSMARVGTDGPFSNFPCIDRTLAILEGEGLRIAVEGRPAVEVTRHSAPQTFPADAATQSTLLGGPVMDLNVMTRRGQFFHRIRRTVAPGPHRMRSGMDTTLLLCHRGTVTVRTAANSATLASLDCAVLDGSAVDADLSGGPEAEFYWIEIGPRT